MSVKITYISADPTAPFKIERSGYSDLYLPGMNMDDVWDVWEGPDYIAGSLSIGTPITPTNDLIYNPHLRTWASAAGCHFLWVNMGVSYPRRLLAYGTYSYSGKTHLASTNPRLLSDDGSHWGVIWPGTVEDDQVLFVGGESHVVYYQRALTPVYPNV